MAALRVTVASCMALLASQPVVYAQMSDEELRRERMETIEALQSTENISGGSSKLFGELGRRTGWIFNYGAASSISWTGGDNGSDRSYAVSDASEHAMDYEVKPFINVTTKDRKSKFYFRATTKYTSTAKNGRPGSPGAGTRGNNYIEPTVDMVYWEKEFAPKAGSAAKRKMTIGRQFAQVGRGIAFALTADGLLYDVTGLGKKKKGEYKWFLLQQNHGDDNIDASSAGSGRTKRFFYGIRGKYAVLPKWKASLYTVYVQDHNEEQSPTSAFQKHMFEPQYYGHVGEGRITKDLQYWYEAIHERGRTYSTGTAARPSIKVNIRASMLTTGLKYYFSGDLKPTVFAEFAQASGDPDATSSNSTSGGSAPGTNDSRFNPFGGLSMGLALSPTLTNMKIYKIGGSIKPFARSVSRSLQDISIQPEYYVYRRRLGGGGAAGNDAQIQATSTNRIGDEIDLSISWRQMSDLVHQLKWGHFSPGSAYSSQSSETYWKYKIAIDL